MPALNKVFPYIIAHYRSGIHASNTSWTVLIRYRGNVFTGYFYSQYNRPMVSILAVAQVGHCLSAALVRITDGKVSLPQLTEYILLPI